MEKELARLKENLATISDLNGAQAVLSWDQQTMMPPGAAEMRGQQLATLGRITHELGTSAEMGRLLDQLRHHAENLDPESDDAKIIKFAIRDFEKSTRIPPDFIAEQTRVITLANQAWIDARASNQFSVFEPHLEKILELTQQYVDFFPPADHPYDILLDNFEPDLKTADVKAIFDKIRPQQVNLIRAIAQKPPVDDSFLHQPFDEKAQWDFGVEVISSFGYDWKRGRQDRSTHPFTGGPGINDVRITTRLAPDFFNTMLFGTMHEAGHAMYDQGIDPRLMQTNLAGGASMAVHESQSRMWENLVGRSLPFWEFFYQRLQALFPQLKGVSLQQFYRGINKVQPSLIRVEADEATYNLHIMLRLELEIALLEGKVRVKDLPGSWNNLMHEYLGVTPPGDDVGILQDIHWSWGLFGYFSTYALGNLVSAQFWAKINQDNPGLPDQIRSGRFEELLGWLRTNVHVHGRKYLPQELIARVTGSKIDPAPYMKYLQEKFSLIYDL